MCIRDRRRVHGFMKAVGFAIVLGFISVVRCASVTVGCKIATEGAIYDINNLVRIWSVNVTGHNTLEFGICQPLTPCYSKYSYTWAKLLDNGVCNESLTAEGDPVYSRESLNSTDALLVNYSGVGLKCGDGNYEILVYLTCDNSVSTALAAPALLPSESPCVYSVLLAVEEGCPVVDWSKFWAFASSFWPLGTALLVAAGILFGVFGRSMWNTIMFIVFAGTFVSLCMALSYGTLPLDAAIWVVCLVEALSVGIGIGLAYCTAKNQILGIVLLGLWMGVSFTVVLQNFIIRALISGFLLYKVRSKGFAQSALMAAGLLFIPLFYTFFPSEFTFWFSFGATTILCGMIAYSAKELIISIATSLIGAFLVVRGIALAFGGFPGLLEIYEHIRNGEPYTSWPLTIYSAVMLVLAVCFVFVQERLENKRQVKEELDFSAEDSDYKVLDRF
eukprot:TRINITY_DN8889_c0_g1_i16.p1 TRINITY_DN8889_c0_g1~~TRINITY_DN8889_c0_g1_i16.p1  ORF type:complete len:446 (+),score=106.73 TRINITY_DN8889_c0_g1_i16:72-1409(+)